MAEEVPSIITEMLDCEKDYYYKGITVPKYDNSHRILLEFKKYGKNMHYIQYDGYVIPYNHHMWNLRCIEEEYIFRKSQNKELLKLITRKDRYI
jgi:hypothetical protein